MHSPGDGVPEGTHGWHCPVCAAAIAHTYGPGRKRVYCSAACKQRAYRWRRANGVRILATPWTPAQRSGFRTAHAVRPAVDVVGHARDAAERHVTVCGTFARKAQPANSSHTEFVPGAKNSCRSCTRLIGADPAWARLYPPGRVVWADRRWDWVPNPPEQRRREYEASNHTLAA